MAEIEIAFVADASVLFKWLTKEKEYLEQALMFKEDFIRKKFNIIVPTYCFSELCNAIYLKHPNLAMQFYSYLLLSGIKEYHLNLNLVNIAFQLMGQYPCISFYDAFYHALAINKGVTFITADEKYYKKTRKAGHVMLLKDYGKKR